MKRWACVALLGLAACEGSAPVAVSADEKSAQKAFEEWRLAIVNWQPEKIYRGLSVGMISDWLYQRLNDSEDSVMRKNRGKLMGEASDDLDIWYVTNKAKNPDRPTLLPGSVLQTAWLYHCFEEYMRPFKDRLKQEYVNVEVSAVYVDSLGATVVVRNKVYQGSDRYVLVFEAGWKIDEHIEPKGLLTK
jgi:hypothetical protein